MATSLQLSTGWYYDDNEQTPKDTITGDKI